MPVLPAGAVMKQLWVMSAVFTISATSPVYLWGKIAAAQRIDVEGQLPTRAVRQNRGPTNQLSSRSESDNGIDRLTLIGC
jgi:hypothetical protein